MTGVPEEPIAEVTQVTVHCPERSLPLQAAAPRCTDTPVSLDAAPSPATTPPTEPCENCATPLLAYSPATVRSWRDGATDCFYGTYEMAWWELVAVEDDDFRYWIEHTAPRCRAARASRR